MLKEKKGFETYLFCSEKEEDKKIFAFFEIKSTLQVNSNSATQIIKQISQEQRMAIYSDFLKSVQILNDKHMSITSYEDLRLLVEDANYTIVVPLFLLKPLPYPSSKGDVLSVVKEGEEYTESDQTVAAYIQVMLLESNSQDKQF